jgi:glycosyltransferase involved in cell wall biosynthesis
MNRSKAHNNHLIFVGDLEPWKGVHTLVEVMKRLRQKKEDFSLRVVGSGSLEADLRKQADGLDIQFFGQKSHDDIPELMSQSFACLLPSLWEAIPTVGLEAMAAGVPFIGTNVGGIPEIIDSGKTGLLVSPNAPDEMVKAILTLKNEKTWFKLRRAALDFVISKHDINTMVTQIEEVYKNVVRKYG